MCRYLEEDDSCLAFWCVALMFSMQDASFETLQSEGADEDQFV